jgi:ribosomal protein S18 acetylase RimI-like enzyme
LSDKIEIIPLTKKEIPEANVLLSDYFKGQINGCTSILRRLLDFQIVQFLLARVNGTPGGFLVYDWGFSMTKGLPVLRVVALYTAKEFRKRSVATGLVYQAKAIAKKHGASRLQLETDQENIPARSLYAKLGFDHLPEKEVYMLFL